MSDLPSKEQILESNLSVFSEICLSLDKLYAYLNHCEANAGGSHPDVTRLKGYAKDLYIFSSASMDCVKKELEVIDAK